MAPLLDHYKESDATNGLGLKEIVDIAVHGTCVGRSWVSSELVEYIMVYSFPFYRVDTKGIGCGVLEQILIAVGKLIVSHG